MRGHADHLANGGDLRIMDLHCSGIGKRIQGSPNVNFGGKTTLSRLSAASGRLPRQGVRKSTSPTH
jgi:hypothetical protein